MSESRRAAESVVLPSLQTKQQGVEAAEFRMHAAYFSVKLAVQSDENDGEYDCDKHDNATVEPRISDTAAVGRVGSFLRHARALFRGGFVSFPLLLYNFRALFFYPVCMAGDYGGKLPRHFQSNAPEVSEHFRTPLKVMYSGLT